MVRLYLNICLQWEEHFWSLISYSWIYWRVICELGVSLYSNPFRLEDSSQSINTEKTEAQAVGDVKGLPLRQKLGHRQIRLSLAVAWLYSRFWRLSDWLRLLSIRKKWCREAIMALLCSVTVRWKPLSYQTWSSEPRKTSGSCYRCNISQQGALAVAHVQGFTSRIFFLKKKTQALLWKHNQELSGATVENGPPAVWPENAWFTDLVFLSHGQMRKLKSWKSAFQTLRIQELKFKDGNQLAPRVGRSFQNKPFPSE